jgi:hypothetical protein
MTEHPTAAERQEKARWWLASIVMRQEGRVMARFVRMYVRLASRSGGMIPGTGAATLVGELINLAFIRTPTPGKAFKNLYKSF